MTKKTIYLIKSEIVSDDGRIDYSEDLVEAKNEKEAVMNWVYDNYELLVETDINEKREFKHFELVITEAKKIKERPKGD